MRNKGKEQIMITVGLTLILIASYGYFYFAFFAPKASQMTPVTRDAQTTVAVDGSAKLPVINKDDSFTIVALPDTQFYSMSHPDIFCKQTDWIASHKESMNIVFVSQLGDIVNDGGKRLDEWANASKCLGKLDGVSPYSVVPGNHDLDISGNKASGFSTFDKYFPVSRFSNNSWYGGYYGSNRNNFEIISANGMKLAFLNLEIEPSDGALNWAQSEVRAHPDAYTILTTHKYLPDNSNSRDSSLSFSSNGNTGESIWKKLVNLNCQISLTLNGHYAHASQGELHPAAAGENHVTSTNSCGKSVNQVEQDYQSLDNGGNGWLRLFVFTPKTRSIKVYTYSPYLDALNLDDPGRFDMKM